MLILRQSTSSNVVIGPYVDSTDGVTAETGLTIANTDILLSKNGATQAAKNSGGGTHDSNGWYAITLDATDTNTVGRLQLSSSVAGAVPVFHDYQVVEEATYDALFASAADLGMNVTQINSSSSAAVRLALSANQIIPGTVDTVTNTHTPTATEFQADDITEATTDHYKDRIVYFTSGALAGQFTNITGYTLVGGIGQFTVASLTEAPANNDTFILV